MPTNRPRKRPFPTPDPEYWVTWLLAFAQREWESIPASDRQALLNELVDFCAQAVQFDRRGLPHDASMGLTGSFARALVRGRPPGTLAQLLQIHQHLRQALRSLLPEQLEPGERLREWVVPAGPTEIRLVRVVAQPGWIPFVYPFRRVKKIGQTWKTLQAGWPDFFWLTVAELFEWYGPRLRRCVECRGVFLATKRQTYCSRVCSQRVRTRRWYQAHRSALLEKRHQRYVRKVRETVHPRARVTRRKLHGA